MSSVCRLLRGRSVMAKSKVRRVEQGGRGKEERETEEEGDVPPTVLKGTSTAEELPAMAYRGATILREC